MFVWVRLYFAPGLRRRRSKAGKAASEQLESVLAGIGTRSAQTSGRFTGDSKAKDRGKFCQQVIDEIKRIKHLYVGTGRSVAKEMQKSEHSDWAVWNVRESLAQEDQDTLNHPRRWGPTTGYAEEILGKT